MTQCIKTKFVGLDVHKDSIVIAVAELGREAARVLGTVPYEWKALRKVLDKLGPASAVHCCYEGVRLRQCRRFPANRDGFRP